MLDINILLNIISALLLVPFLFELNQVLLKKLKKKYGLINKKKLNLLFVYHIFFGAIYYIYAFSNPSDSKRYFRVPNGSNKSWFEFFGTETTFIDFISYPFINFFGFSYEMMMLLFAWIGYWGFVFGFLFFRENIKEKVKVFRKVDLLTLILFFPNMHFWSASLGKGALIFFGLMLFAFSITRPEKRKTGILISSLLIFAVRPHMFLLIAIGSLYGLFFGKNLVSKRKKLLGGMALLTGIFLFQEKILAVMNLNGSSHLIEDFLSLAAERSNSLSNASSGVAMSQYSLPEKIFTFWFRPLFLDAPGILGIIVSIENLIYLLLFAKLLRKSFFKFWKCAPANVKSSLMIFILTSFAMTFIMSNLGIMIRQKTMIMYFMFFVIYYFLAFENSEKVKSKVQNFGAAKSQLSQV
ncbi:hypothetical protein [Christiangramia aestuarii]|uniref:Uncharacterized protein n=1 Tax=Christiangramia aestuarii TaxID=1028746 RepID=A0A7M3SWR7_9FLAO|nr:hypothetical protein [Christiangramia aestuarii]MUP41048.1 hypothetical protein [Christiangramia aestuarii]